MEITIHIITRILWYILIFVVIADMETMLDLTLGDFRKFIVVISVIIILIYVFPIGIDYFVNGNFITNKISITTVSLMVLSNCISYYEENKQIALFKYSNKGVVRRITIIVMILYFICDWLIT